MFCKHIVICVFLSTLGFDVWAAPPRGYRLVWSDEFNGRGLPAPSKWSYDTEANQSGWYNNELQYYAAANRHFSRRLKGKLLITARKQAMAGEPDYGGQQYSSARLITRDKASWTYGFFEIRAKLPCSLGTWPAIWLLGTEGDWPAGGEIDIMEHVGKTPGIVYGTIHNTATAGTSGDGGQIEVKTACRRYHNYQLTWTPQRLDIGVDGTIFHSYANDGSGSARWPFDRPQYLILNLAIGGDMAGPVVDDDGLPAKLAVEYVRVYQMKPP
ncbi:MAG: glycoside hydrolase family 16 protein [Methylococcaceae bacterium]|nr:glycoside hydrolase family 16 protein [Methylococcaceae bacterium]